MTSIRDMLLAPTTWTLSLIRCLMASWNLTSSLSRFQLPMMTLSRWVRRED